MVKPKKINRKQVEKQLTELYQKEGRAYFIYRLTESGQHVMTRSYLLNGKLAIDHVPVFFDKNRVYLDYRVEGREIMSYEDWFLYLYIIEKDELLYK